MKHLTKYNRTTTSRRYSLTSLLGFVLMLTTSVNANGQILLVLLLGDALNSEKVEFGVTGGLNRSYILDISESEGLNNFNLGFYFHISIKNNSYFSTGALIKSNVGARGMTAYSIGEADFDMIYTDAELTKKISYLYVPVMWHQRFQDRWYLEGGFQLGIRSKANDFFEKEEYDGELIYSRNVKDEYKSLDSGLIGGIGYKLSKETKSMSAGVSYYHGLMDVSALEGVDIHNSSINLYVKIPVGAAKSEKSEN